MTGATDAPQSQPDDLIRPFLMTKGRTTTSVEGLRFETLVQATDTSGDDLRFEPARVFAQCHEATAIAEISALLHLPIGSVKVVVGDLIESGHLELHRSLDSGSSKQADIELISRLIDGVRKL